LIILSFNVKIIYIKYIGGGTMSNSKVIPNRVFGLSTYLSKNGYSNSINTELTSDEDGVIAISGTSLEIEIGDTYVNLVNVTSGGPVYIYTGDKAVMLLEALNIEKPIFCS
jgi:hypothetical protein